MKPLRWPTSTEEHQYMFKRKAQNLARTHSNGNENWMAAKLAGTGRKWSRQAMWGYRVFDFWCAELGIAVECDGPEHREAYDAYRDEYNYRRSGIVVLRVRNQNDEDAEKALAAIAAARSWKERRELLGLNARSKVARRALVRDPAPVGALTRAL